MASAVGFVVFIVADAVIVAVIDAVIDVTAAIGVAATKVLH